MGIPSFFRWIQSRYPCVIQNIAHDDPRVDVNLHDPNLNNFEINNLYIDCNGMIHPCFHPEDRPPPETEAEIFEEVFLYLDRLVRIARPRNLLYLAIDGCAPRAKLNQQRARRFHAAFEAQFKKNSDRVLHKTVETGSDKDPNDAETDAPPPARLDSNTITPGTPFMARLSLAIKYYVAHRQATSAYWQSLTVIFSDAQCPGEGEHKIMQFIRQQRSRPGYDPNQVHCIQGLDADLIMLALATHERNFTILREVVFTDRHEVVCKKCGQVYSKVKKGKSPSDMLAGDGNVLDDAGDQHDAETGYCPYVVSQTAPRPVIYNKAFQFLHVWTLRDYLMNEFQCTANDFERVLDDFVFLCYLAGNDFLCHLECLNIRDNAILRIIEIYSRLRRTPGCTQKFLTCNNSVIVPHCIPFLHELAALEPFIFQDKARSESFRKQNLLDSLKQELAPLESELDSDGVADDRREFLENKIQSLRQRMARTKNGLLAEVEIYNKYYDTVTIAPDDCVTLAERFVSHQLDLHTKGYRERYYKAAGILPDAERGSEHATTFEDDVLSMCLDFIEGMIWVFRYYYSPKVENWGWYYKHHYAPLAEDLARAIAVYGEKRGHVSKVSGAIFEEQPLPSRTGNRFAQELQGMQNPADALDASDKIPFKPYEQLLAVLPAYSSEALPEPYARLMLTKDSPLAGFYPNRYESDVSGKHAIWAATLRLPFIDTALLRKHAALAEERMRAQPDVYSEQIRYNLFTDAVIIVHKNHPCFSLYATIMGHKALSEEQKASALERHKGNVREVKKETLSSGDVRKTFQVIGASLQEHLLSGAVSRSSADFFTYGSMVSSPLGVAATTAAALEFGPPKKTDETADNPFADEVEPEVRATDYKADGGYSLCYRELHPGSLSFVCESLQIRYLNPAVPMSWNASQLLRSSVFPNRFNREDWNRNESNRQRDVSRLHGNSYFRSQKASADTRGDEHRALEPHKKFST